jgi:hypothetical protein
MNITADIAAKVKEYLEDRPSAPTSLALIHILPGLNVRFLTQMFPSDL